MRFRATLVLHGETATGMSVPEEIVTALGAGNRPPLPVRGSRPVRPAAAPNPATRSGQPSSSTA